MSRTQPPANPADNYDSPWKEAIEHYYPEFMAFYFPDASVTIDWSKKYTSLDNELRAIFPEAKVSNRVVDKLVQVELLQGTETWLYIHIEVQSTRRSDFARRMFVYNYRIFDKYDKPVASLAILADRDRQWRPNSWGFAFAGSKHTLEFSIVKLIDYEPTIDELLTLDNAFGLLTAAHLLTQTRRKNEERYHAKLRLIRLLYERQWERKRIVELLRVIDWFLELPKELRQKLKTEICQIEEQQKMKYVTSFERDALEEGIEKGIVLGKELGVVEGTEKGVLQGRLEVARNLVASGFSTEQAASIANVPIALL
ncbi:MAG: hypothetical protein ACOYLR_11690 [Chlorobium sp.]